LERRLLLRRILTKALEIRRAETARLAEGDEIMRSSPERAITPSPGSMRDSSRKLCFYDVVQLARQQALAEKTRESNRNFRSSGDLEPSEDIEGLDAFEPSEDFERIDDGDPDEDSRPWEDLKSSDFELTDDLKPLEDLKSSDESHLLDDLIDPTKDFKLLENLNSSHISQLSNDLIGPLESFTPAENLKSNDESHSMDDLIDFSDTPLPMLKLNPPDKLQDGYDLLDSGNPLALDQIDSSLLLQNAFGTPHLNQFMTDATTSQQTSIENTPKLIKAQASQVHGLFENETSELMASAATLHQQNCQTLRSNTALMYRGFETGAGKTPTTLESVHPESVHAGDSSKQEANELCMTPTASSQQSFLIHHFSDALISQGNPSDGAPAETSPTSTAAPSIFSHSSTLSSATGFSPGITAEDLQARISSSSTSLKSSSFSSKFSPSLFDMKPPGSPSPSQSKSSVQVGDGEVHRSPSTSTAAAIHADLMPPSKSLQTRAEGDVSQLSPLPPDLDLDEPDKEGFPWIVQAARDGNEEMIQKLLKSGADVKATHVTTLRNAISEASMQGHQNVVNLLIEENCPLVYDAEGYSALHLACQGGHLNVAKTLINHGALIDVTGPQGQTPLHLAIQVPHQNVVMLLIQQKASVNARNATSQTPLHICASQGNVAMCDYLINEGAHLDSRDMQSKTALQLACEAGHHDLVQMMLNQSNLNPTNMTFLSAFFAAVECGHVQIAESFFSRGLKLQELVRDSSKPVTLAAKSGCLAMVELMLEAHGDLNADENGWNALHFASHCGHYQVIDRLVASNVSTKAITSKKQTPLLLAVKGGHFAVAESLLRSNQDGSSIKAEDEYGQHPIHHATRTGSVEIVKLLMSYGTKVNVENSFGWEPLHIATAYGHLDLVQRLLEQGANIEGKLGSPSIKRDKTHKLVEDGYWAEARWPYSGSRPMHLACEYGHYQIAQCLKGKGAKLESTCSEGWQPLHYAAFIGSSVLVEMLLESGVYPHATTNEGKTAETLQFCTSGEPIPDEEKERIRMLLRGAMDRVRKQKQKSFKAALKRGSTVEEKNKLIRAATSSKDIVSRPQLHRSTATIQPLGLSLTHSQRASSLQRPQIPHLPHTSPLPLNQSHSVSSLHLTSTSQLERPRVASQMTSPSIATVSSLQFTNALASAAETARTSTDHFVTDSSLQITDATNALTSAEEIASSTMNQLVPDSSVQATNALTLIEETASSAVDQLVTDSTVRVTNALTSVERTASSTINQLINDSSVQVTDALASIEETANSAMDQLVTGSELQITNALTSAAEVATETTDHLITESSLHFNNVVTSAAETASNAADQLSLLKDTAASVLTPTPHIEAQISSVPLTPKNKRRAALALKKMKPGIEMRKMGIGNLGRQTLEIGKQTLEIGNKGLVLGRQGLELGMQGIELGRQGVELGKHGFESGKQGLEMVQGLNIEKGIDLGKMGLRKAATFAIRSGEKSEKGEKGSVRRIGARKRMGKKKRGVGNDGGDDVVGAVVCASVLGAAGEGDGGDNNDDGKDDNDDDDGEDVIDDDDDAGSVFSLGEFGDLGNDDF